MKNHMLPFLEPFEKQIVIPNEENATRVNQAPNLSTQKYSPRLKARLTSAAFVSAFYVHEQLEERLFNAAILANELKNPFFFITVFDAAMGSKEVAEVVKDAISDPARNRDLNTYLLRKVNSLTQSYLPEDDIQEMSDHKLRASIVYRQIFQRDSSGIQLVDQKVAQLGNLPNELPNLNNEVRLPDMIPDLNYRRAQLAARLYKARLPISYAAQLRR